MATRIAVMKDGILQQVDTPQNLYDYPDNVFVGGFIGSPAMNFFNARLEKSDGRLIVDTGEFAVAIPDDRRSTYDDYIGKEIVFGIRPEDIHDPEYTPPGIKPAKVDTHIEVKEPMGNEVILYLRNGNQSFVGRVDPRSASDVNTDKQLIFNMDNMHIFDTEGDQRAVR